MLKKLMALLLLGQIGWVQADEINDFYKKAYQLTHHALISPYLRTVGIAEDADDSKKIICPPPVSYSLLPGNRFAGVSPACQAVQIPMQEITEGLIDQSDEANQYQFIYRPLEWTLSVESRIFSADK